MEMRKDDCDTRKEIDEIRKKIDEKKKENLETKVTLDKLYPYSNKHERNMFEERSAYPEIFTRIEISYHSQRQSV